MRVSRQKLFIGLSITVFATGCSALALPEATPTPTQIPTATPNATDTPEPTPTATPEVVQELPLVLFGELFIAFRNAGLQFEYNITACVSSEFVVYDECVTMLDMCPGEVKCVEAVAVFEIPPDWTEYDTQIGDSYTFLIKEGLVVPESWRHLVASLETSNVYECVIRDTVNDEVRLVGVWNVSREISDFLYYPRGDQDRGLPKSLPPAGGYGSWATCALSE